MKLTAGRLRRADNPYDWLRLNPCGSHHQADLFMRRDYREKRSGFTYPEESITHLYCGDIPVWDLEGEFRDFTEIEKVELKDCRFLK